MIITIFYVIKIAFTSFVGVEILHLKFIFLINHFILSLKFMAAEK